MNGILLVLANAEPGRDDDFNHWYDATHLRETLSIHPGFLWGRRFALTDALMTRDTADAPFQYLTMYDVEDIEAADAELYRVARTERAVDLAEGRTPRHVKHEAMSSDLRTWWYQPISKTIGDGPDTDDPDRQLLMVFSNAREGLDDDFNAWYSGFHLAEILRIDDAFQSARRYELVDASMTVDSPDMPYRYLAVYDVSDIAAADAGLYHLARIERAEAFAAGRTPRLVMSPSMDGDLRTWWFSSMGAVVTRAALAQ